MPRHAVFMSVLYPVFQISMYEKGVEGVYGKASGNWRGGASGGRQSGAITSVEALSHRDGKK